MEKYFWPFLEFYFPKIAAQIDQQQGYTFLDQELSAITRKAESHKRRMDKLAKVYLPVASIAILADADNRFRPNSFETRAFGETYLRSIALPEEAMGWKIKSVRLFRIGSDYYVHVVYREIPGETKSKEKYGAGIDVGLDNLLAILSDNPESNSFIVSGKEIKAFNQWYNKQRAALQERLSALKKESKESGGGPSDRNRAAHRKTPPPVGTEKEILR